VPQYRGSDGPSIMLLWRQGEPHPIDDLASDPYRIDPNRYTEFSLPDTFSITGTCERGHVLQMECRCSDGVWTEVDASSEQARVDEARTHRRGWFRRRTQAPTSRA
jgi:hypothetical protein